MIERVSRYYDGPLFQIKQKYTGQYSIGVFRAFPESKAVRFIEYTWIDGDSFGNLAKVYIGHAKYWWEILEINPEITDPFNIAPGTIIRIPYDN
jgi:nucleoid-associated protein YgaU